MSKHASGLKQLLDAQKQLFPPQIQSAHRPTCKKRVLLFILFLSLLSLLFGIIIMILFGLKCQKYSPPAAFRFIVLLPLSLYVILLLQADIMSVCWREQALLRKTLQTVQVHLKVQGEHQLPLFTDLYILIFFNDNYTSY